MVRPTDVILFEGTLALYSKEVRNTFSMKVFVDEDSDVRLSRRILRDIMDHGRSLDFTIQQYLKFVKPSFDDYILPVSS
jgi:uridine kinase